MAADPETWKDPGSAGMVVMRTTAYVFAVQAIHQLLGGAPRKKEDKDEHWYTWAAKAMALSAAGGIPIARDLMPYFLGERDYSVTPAAEMASSLHQSKVDAMHAYEGKHESTRWLKHAIQNTGYVFGLPTGQAANTAQFLWDVEQGKQDPHGFGEWWNGVVTGQAKKK